MTPSDGDRPPGPPTAAELARLLDRRSARGALDDQLFRALIDASPVAIWLLDPLGTVLLWNPAAERLTGWSASEVVGRPLPVIPPSQREEFRALLASVLAGTPLVDRDLARQRKDGRVLACSLSVAPIRDAAGASVAVVTMAVDASPRRRAEAAARTLAAEQAAREAAEQVRAELEDVLDSMSDAFFAYDADWRVVRLNRAGRDMVRRAGVESEAVLGRSIWASFPRLAETGLGDAMRRCARDRAPATVEQLGPHSGRWLEAHVYPTAEGTAAYVRDVTDRKRAETAQRLLTEASASLTASLDFDVTVDRVARLAVPALADWCVVDLIEAEAGAPIVRRAAAVHADPARQPVLDELRRRYPPRAERPTLASAVIASGRAQLVAEVPDAMIDQVSADAGQAALVRALGLASYIIAPLSARGRLLGVVAFLSAARRYDADDLALAEELARRAAITLDNAALFREARVAAERTARLQAVTAGLAGAFTAEAVAETVVREGVAALRAADGILCLTSADGRWLEIVRAEGLAEETVREFDRFPVDGPFPLSEALREGRTIVMASREAVVSRYPALAAANARARAESWVAVPLLADGGALGGLTFGFAERRAFAPEDVAFLEALAQQCAQALERARLLERAERERARVARLQTVTAALAAAVSSDDVAQALLDRGLAAVGASAGVVCRLNETATDVERVWALGYPDEGLERFRRVALTAPLPPRDVARTREPVWVESPADWEARYLPPGPGMTTAPAAAGLPLLVGERLVGVMVLRFPEARTFAPDDRALMTSVASQCAQALERARLHEAERAARLEAEDARARADEANLAKTEFLAVMSHELRTPLNAIAGYSELLDLGVHGALTEVQREAIGRIQRNQRHLLGLINDVLNFAKLDAGHVNVQLADVPVHETLAALEELVAPQVRAKRLTYRYQPADPALVARADAEKVRQVLLNLLSNAIKFTPAGGRVTVSAVGADGDVHLRVADTGQGIPADKLERIFEPFVQVDPGRTRTNEGTGLGLAISRDLARAMGGEISVASALGAGSTFTLTLPRG